MSLADGTYSPLGDSSTTMTFLRSSNVAFQTDDFFWDGSGLSRSDGLATGLLDGRIRLLPLGTNGITMIVAE